MRLLLITFISCIFHFSFAQETNYSHCNCVETLTEESYKVVSNAIEVESGQFKAGKRTGLWLSRNSKGKIIRQANYIDGKLDGSYELFHLDGKPKLTAEFLHGRAVGTWTYFNAKGKVIKEGDFIDGKPTGVWRILDKKGKKIYAEYNFESMTETVSPSGKQHFRTGNVIRDDQSGEWMILYLPRRSINVQTQPLGGYLLSTDLFIDYFNLPTILMDTYTQFEFNTTVKLYKGVATVVSVELLENNEKFDISSHSLPFMVDTNPPSKLSRIEHSKATIDFLKDQLAEYVLITGPWISTKEIEEIIIRTPIVVNEVKRW